MRDQKIKRRMQWVGVGLACASLLSTAAAQDSAATHSGIRVPYRSVGDVSIVPAPAGVQSSTASSAPAMPESISYQVPSGALPMAKENTTPEDQEEAAARDKNGGIRVHGHWVVEVKRKDGTVKERREFENSYSGGYMMELNLLGFIAPADAAISFFSSTNGPGSMCNGLENTASSSNNSCQIFTSLTAGHGAADTVFGYCAVAGSCYSGLNAALTPGSGSPPTTWVLSATIIAVTSGTFDSVGTGFNECYRTDASYDYTYLNVSPAACFANAGQYAQNFLNKASFTPPYPPADNGYGFTSTLLPGGAVSVTAGEYLIFTVTISFS